MNANENQKLVNFSNPERFEALVKQLQLPKDFHVTEQDVIDSLNEMPNSFYKGVLVEHFVYGELLKDMEQKQEYFGYSLRGILFPACMNLKRAIYDHFYPEQRAITSVCNYRIIDRLGLSRATIDEVLTMLQRYEYRECLDIDRLVISLHNTGFKFIYPKFLMCHPEYPYSLYSDILDNDGIRKKKNRTVSDKYHKYMYRAIRNETYVIENFCKHCDRIFSDDNRFITERERIILRMYYKENIGLRETADALDVSESLVRGEIRASLARLNTPEATEFIHTGILPKNLSSLEHVPFYKLIGKKSERIS